MIREQWDFTLKNPIDILSLLYSLDLCFFHTNQSLPFKSAYLLNPTHLLASSNQDVDPAYSETDPTPTETDYYYPIEEEAGPEPESELTGYEETSNKVNHTH